MKIKILYFGNINDITHRSYENLVVNNQVKNIQKLTEYLSGKYPKLENQEYQISCRQKLVNMDCQINDGDEIALLPPFSGG